MHGNLPTMKSAVHRTPALRVFWDGFVQGLCWPWTAFSRGAVTPSRKRSPAEARITLVFPIGSYERIRSLQRAIGAPSTGAVCLEALRIYGALIQEWQDGKDIVILSPDGTERPVFADADEIARAEAIWQSSR